MMSRASGDLVYWNAHTGFGEIDLDDRDGRIGVYRDDLLRAGVRRPQVGDRFHFNTGVAANGVTATMDLCPDGVGASSRRELGRVARLRLSGYGLGHAVQAQCRAPSPHPEDPLSDPELAGL